MHLHSLKVENYRAIRLASLSFGRSTALIGENDCGKSSLLETMALLLDPKAGDKVPELQPYHFHRRPGAHAPLGILRITLTFQEQEPDEWNTPQLEPISHLLPRSGKRLRRVRLQLRAKLEADQSVLCEWRLHVPGTDQASSDPALLAWIRRVTPIIHLPPGTLTGHSSGSSTDDPSRAESSEIPPDLQELMVLIDSSAQALRDRTSIHLADDLTNGFEAVRELIERTSQSDDTSRPTLARKVREILGTRSASKSQGLALALPAAGSQSEQLGILLLVAALLRASPGGLSEAVEPIWIIEDPEAHLHPITLASVGYFLADIHWQKIVTTNSAPLVASIPLGALRRITRVAGEVTEHRVNIDALSRTDLRRIAYHLGARNGSAPFARLWLLVEGESEIWILPQLARLLGYEFSVEGIQCIEFAQSGLSPLVKVARELGIAWHLLADGDKAGHSYLSTVRHRVRKEVAADHFTLLPEHDIEHCFWEHGYADVFREHAGLSKQAAKRLSPDQVINRAVKNRSKPDLALQLIEAAASPNSPGVPPVIKDLITTLIRLARRNQHDSPN